ncbi:MAG: lysophospholipid acyltransferase family protein [Deltaproteobacteria bacterium]|nr:lysophospholipid acyltransferase family protein [Deltaproteobacteria bacterium]
MPSPPPKPIPDYAALEVKKSAWTKPLRRWLQAVVFRGALAVIPLLPFRFTQALGKGTGRLFFRFSKKSKATALAQLAMAFPDWSEDRRRQTARDCFVHLGCTLWEILAMARVQREARRWLVMENEEVLRAAQAEGRGVLALVGHIGNWEMMSPMLGLLGMKGQAIMAPRSSEELTRIMVESHQAPHLGIIIRGSPQAPQQMIRALKRGEIILMAVDQDMEARGVFVEFFGRLAHTPRVAGSLALKHRLPVVASFDVRRPDGTHAVRFQRLEVPPDIPPGEEGVRQMTQLLTRATEEHIRQHPAQWVWFHHRWKRRPEEPTGAGPVESAG